LTASGARGHHGAMSTFPIGAGDALVIIDVQPDFLPDGPLPVPRGDEVIAPIARVVARFDTVVATQDWHPPGHVSFASSHPGRKPFDTIDLYGAPQTLWPDHCVQGTPGARLCDGLPKADLDLILRKGTRLDSDSYSAFRENVGPDGHRHPTGLAGFLRERNVRRVFLCGLARDVCVRFSALDAAAADFATFVIDDATRAVHPQRRAETDRAFAEAGVTLVASDDLL